MMLVIPVGETGNRVNADALNGNAQPLGLVNLVADIVKPCRTSGSFGAGFRDQYRSPVALVDLYQHVDKRTIIAMA
jgi:hypothetical protein